MVLCMNALIRPVKAKDLLPFLDRKSRLSLTRVTTTTFTITGRVDSVGKHYIGVIGPNNKKYRVHENNIESVTTQPVGTPYSFVYAVDPSTGR